MPTERPIRFCSQCGKRLVRVTGIPVATVCCNVCHREIDDRDVLDRFGVYACGQRFRGAASVGENDVVDVNDFEFSTRCNVVCVDCQRGSIGTLPAREVSRVITTAKRVVPGGAGAAAVSGVTRDDRRCPRCNPPWTSSVTVNCLQHRNAAGIVEFPADCSTDVRWITSSTTRCERCHQASPTWTCRSPARVSCASAACAARATTWMLSARRASRPRELERVALTARR